MTRSHHFHPASSGLDLSDARALRTGDANGGLITQLHPKDFAQLHGQKEEHGDATVKHLPQTKITDIARDKAVIADENASKDQKLAAARELIENGETTFKLRDGKGIDHEIQLARRDENGKKIVTISEKLLDGLKTICEGSVAEAALAPKPETVQPPESSRPPLRTAGGGGGGGGSYRRVRLPRRPEGMSYGGSDYGSTGRYSEPSGGSSYTPSNVDSHVWQGVRHSDGSVAISFRGCQVDTDGSGAWRHREDPCRQNRTSLRLSSGQSLDTDRDNFFVLPNSVAKAYGIKQGDLGWLVRKDNGKAVPVVFGDVGPEGKLGEASVKALKDLGYTNVNGANGVSGDRFEIVFVPGSGDGTGDIASNSQAMAAKLNSLGVAVGDVQLT